MPLFIIDSIAPPDPNKGVIKKYLRKEMREESIKIMNPWSKNSKTHLCANFIYHRDKRESGVGKVLWFTPHTLTTFNSQDDLCPKLTISEAHDVLADLYERGLVTDGIVQFFEKEGMGYRAIHLSVIVVERSKDLEWQKFIAHRRFIDDLITPVLEELFGTRKWLWAAFWTWFAAYVLGHAAEMCMDNWFDWK